MGADLLVACFELDGTKTTPNWDAGLAAIETWKPTEQDLAYIGEQSSGDEEMSEAEAKQLVRDACSELQDMWSGQHRCATRITLRRSQVLVAGGLSWGDEPFEGWSLLGVLDAAGPVMQAAGFGGMDTNAVTIKL